MAPFHRPTWQDHAQQLAKAFDAILVEAPLLDPASALAIPPIRVAIVAPITDESRYAIALHELGHIVAPVGALGGPRTPTREQAEEDAAWTWARHFALDWTPTMEHVRQLAEASYHQTPSAAVPAQPPAPEPAPIRDWIDWSKWEKTR